MSSTKNEEKSGLQTDRQTETADCRFVMINRYFSEKGDKQREKDGESATLT